MQKGKNKHLFELSHLFKGLLHGGRIVERKLLPANQSFRILLVQKNEPPILLKFQCWFLGL